MGTAQPVNVEVRRTRPVLYSALALLSLLVAPFLFTLMLFAGVFAVLIGSVIGAFVHEGPRQDRAVVAVCCGLALLVGPTLSLLLALGT